LHEQIMRTTEREEPLLNSYSTVFHGLCRAKRLGRNGHDGSEDILDAMMELADQQRLQLLNRPPFSGVDAGLLQEATQVKILGLKPQLLFRRHWNLLAGLART
jgi:hypothetical protein